MMFDYNLCTVFVDHYKYKLFSFLIDCIDQTVDAVPDNGVTTYHIERGGTQKGRDLLVDSDGFSYTVN